jgi:hypothetical protein
MGNQPIQRRLSVRTAAISTSHKLHSSSYSSCPSDIRIYIDIVYSIFGTTDPMYSTEFVITIVRPVTEKLSIEELLTRVHVPSHLIVPVDITSVELS